MRKYKKVKRYVEEMELISITCDVCNKEYFTEDDALEMQEFYSLRKKGSYMSVFGDGVIIEIDMCQHCFKKLLGKSVKLIDVDVI